MALREMPGFSQKPHNLIFFGKMCDIIFQVGAPMAENEMVPVFYE
jgi:hypothetical protein